MREAAEDGKHVGERHTHESDVDSDEGEERAPKKRLRPPHVPGSLGLAPPSSSARGCLRLRSTRRALVRSVRSRRALGVLMARK